MSSILTNSSALTALQNLSNTQRSLSTVQDQISSGLKVATAKDNSSYWSIASTMKSDNGALGVVKSSLEQGNTMVSTVYTAVTSIIDQMNTIKNNLVAAKQPGADLDKIGTTIKAAQDQLKSLVTDSAVNGSNWLDGSSTTGVNIVSSFNRDSTGATSVGTISVSSTALYASATGATASSGILEGGDGTAAGTGTNFITFSVSSATTSTDLDTYIKDSDATLAKLQTVGASLGAMQTRLESQSSFITTMSDNLTKSVGALVDADMNEASTRLQALQTQQSLGVQSLSIANQNAQSILKLFS